MPPPGGIVQVQAFSSAAPGTRQHERGFAHCPVRSLPPEVLRGLVAAAEAPGVGEPLPGVLPLQRDPAGRQRHPCLRGAGALHPPERPEGGREPEGLLPQHRGQQVGVRGPSGAGGGLRTPPSFLEEEGVKPGLGPHHRAGGQDAVTPESGRERFSSKR